MFPKYFISSTKLLLFLILFRNSNSYSSQMEEVKTEHSVTWFTFINTLNSCTIQVFYDFLDYESWPIISEELQNLYSHFNFVIENLHDPRNRYIHAVYNRLDDFIGAKIVPNFPFLENNFTHIYSNCHLALVFSPPVNLFLQMGGIAAFNEDPDYLIIFDFSRTLSYRHYNIYFNIYDKFRLTSVILYSNMSSNTLSILCHTCTTHKRITDYEDKTILSTKFYRVPPSSLKNFVKNYKQLTKDLNRNIIEFVVNLHPVTLWGIPCSLKHCGLETSAFTCVMSELRV